MFASMNTIFSVETTSHGVETVLVHEKLEFRYVMKSWAFLLQREFASNSETG